MTPADLEVSGYRAQFTSDPNDFWVIEILDDAAGPLDNGRRLRALTTRFRLKHVGTGCYLWCVPIYTEENLRVMS